jgi:hypothetical protein
MNNTSELTVNEAIDFLEGAGFRVGVLREQLAEREKTAALPTQEELSLTLPTTIPNLTEHMELRTLDPSRMWDGFAYTLTPGQRKWLRDHFDMTPTETVVVSQLDRWTGTQSLRAFRLESQLHVDPRMRKHVLTAVWIRNARKFFSESRENDARVDKVKEGGTGTRVGKNVSQPTTIEGLLEQLAKELEAT